MIDKKMCLNYLSVLIPVYNDEEVLDELNKRLVHILPQFIKEYEIVLVDDGSKDNSWAKIEELKKHNGHIVGIKLIRNFGQQNAIAAGLDHVAGDIVVIMDSDLQDRPEDIPKLVQALLKNDASMAIAKWKSRKDGFFKVFASRLFFKVSNRITKIKHQPNLGVFRAIRREVVEELKKYQEKTSSTLSLLYWIGMDYVTVEVERDERFKGKSGYNLKKMLKLALDRIFGFSMFPIRVAIYTGLTISIFSFLFGVVLVVRYMNGQVAPGWTSIVVLVLFFFGVNFIFLGILGEYLGRVFWESKQRPKFIIKKILK
ncbi:MAG: glycosyltransferase family 2 protein [Candidatus Aminicenantes bacterium]|nr:glycosyltransferase family 2 protein [Candidatus Aminicenantes bacterium]